MYRWILAISILLAFCLLVIGLTADGHLGRRNESLGDWVEELAQDVSEAPGRLSLAYDRGLAALSRVASFNWFNDIPWPEAPLRRAHKQPPPKSPEQSSQSSDPTTVESSSPSTVGDSPEATSKSEEQ